MSLLEVSGLQVAENGQIVLQDISFSQQEFQKLAIAGETGSGKSTLLQTIAGLVQPAAGDIWFADKRVIGPREKLVPGHAGIAYLSQHFELPKSLRVEQILGYANTLTPAKAESLFELCRISHLMKRRTNQLSGGEKQRIALARLLLTRPGLLLLDEPFSNLDMGHKRILKAVIQDISNELSITPALISHDPLDTLSWADEIMVMQAGRIIQRGTPQQIYHKPLNTYVAGLFGNYNLIPASGAHAFATLAGLEANGKALLIRPESIKLVSAGEPALKGVVQGVAFYGSFYLAEVIVSGTLLMVQTKACDLRKGEPVFVSYSAADVCQPEV